MHGGTVPLTGPLWPSQEPMSAGERARIERELAQQEAQADRQEAVRERREELLRQVQPPGPTSCACMHW